VGGNNVYDVIVQVSEGSGGTDTRAIAVTVTDVLRQWASHESNRGEWIDPADRGWESFFPLSQRFQLRPVAQIWRSGLCGRSGWCLGANRRGEDGEPVNGRQHLLEQPEPFGQQLEVLKE
jgi:hypothetical protein